MWESATFQKIDYICCYNPKYGGYRFGLNTLIEDDNSNSDPGVIPQIEGSPNKEENTNILGASTRSSPKTGDHQDGY